MQTQPIGNQITLDDLKRNPEFIDFWREVLKGIRRFSMNEAMLTYVHRPKRRVGTIADINATAALDMYRLEGSLEVWETLLFLADKQEETESDDVYAGDRV